MTPLDADLVRRKLAAITRKLDHLKAVERLSLDEYRADPFRVKGTEKLLQEAPSTGLRNRLVHEYEEVNDAIVLRAVAEGRRSFADYVAAVEKFLVGKGV